MLRLVFSVIRRLVAGRVSLGVEYDLRNRIYRHLNSLELAFFDGQQTGQLMSRARPWTSRRCASSSATA